MACEEKGSNIQCFLRCLEFELDGVMMPAVKNLSREDDEWQHVMEPRADEFDDDDGQCTPIVVDLVSDDDDDDWDDGWGDWKALPRADANTWALIYE